MTGHAGYYSKKRDSQVARRGILAGLTQCG